MKTLFFIAIVSLLTVNVSFASESGDLGLRSSSIVERASHLGVGFSVTNLAGNYGIGVEVSSPKIFNDRVYVRLSGTYNWLQGLPNGSSRETWSPYGMFELGFFGSNFIQGSAIRGYGGGGLALLAPSSAVSSSGAVFGGFGLVGLEFFLGENNHSFPMYIELGGLGTGATANQFQNSPIYANGFTATWGLRYFL